MLIDGGWKDAFAEFLGRGLENGTVAKALSHALAKLAASDEYGQKLGEQFSAMIRGKDSNAAAVAYIAAMKDAAFAGRMKKELMIIARGDIGQNQLNAISAISLMKDDAEARKSLVVLLSHWDDNARLAAAEALAGMAEDAEAKAAAKRRLAEETNPDVRKVLEKIAK
jgi:hypothetical protein